MAGGPAAGAQAWAGLSALWCGQLGELATLTAGSPAGEEAERIRALHGLLAAAPRPELIQGLRVPPSDAIERPIAAGASVAAALALFGGDAGYLLSRGSSGLYAASVYLPEAVEDVTAIGDSAGLALVGAIAQALVDRHASREPAPLHLN